MFGMKLIPNMPRSTIPGGSRELISAAIVEPRLSLTASSSCGPLGSEATARARLCCLLRQLPRARRLVADVADLAKISMAAEINRLCASALRNS